MRAPALLVLAAVSIAQSGCDRARPSGDPPNREEPGEAVPSHAKPSERARVERSDERDQVQLATALSEARSTSLEEDPDAYGRVVRSWHGRRYRWELAHVPLLCRTPKACYMAPFDHNRIERRALQGWLPRLEMSDAEFAALEAGCKDTRRCIVRIEGTMGLEASADAPTHVTFTGVRVLGTRAAGDGEAWIVASR